MIEKITLIQAAGTNPYENLALEEYLLQHTGRGEMILYLWQNRHTVVIGYNQDCYRECLVEELERDGGHLARRLSGGGAVYHDGGNLNFTFITSKDTHDVGRQTDVILHGVNALGLDQPAIKSGRNDLTIGERKFSGNAYYKGQANAYHHGTLLIAADMAQLTRYLNVSKDKLHTKGVASVRSRVTNLNDFAESRRQPVTIQEMREALVAAARQVYGVPVTEGHMPSRADETLRALTAKYASPDWKYHIGGKPQPHPMGRKPDRIKTARFAWGGATVSLWMDGGRIVDSIIDSDAMDAGAIGEIKSWLTNQSLDQQTESLADNPYWADIEKLIMEQ